MVQRKLGSLGNMILIVNVLISLYFYIDVDNYQSLNYFVLKLFLILFLDFLVF